MRLPKKTAHHTGANKKCQLVPCHLHANLSSSMTLHFLPKEKQRSHTITGKMKSLPLSFPPVSLYATLSEVKPTFALPQILLTFLYLVCCHEANSDNEEDDDEHFRIIQFSTLAPRTRYFAKLIKTRILLLKKKHISV